MEDESYELSKSNLQFLLQLLFTRENSVKLMVSDLDSEDYYFSKIFYKSLYEWIDLKGIIELYHEYLAKVEIIPAKIIQFDTLKNS